MNKPNDGFATIQFMPVCSKCHSVIYDVIDYKEVTEYMNLIDRNKLAVKSRSIYPAVCTNCGSYFESIVIPRKLPIDNSIKFSRSEY